MLKPITTAMALAILSMVGYAQTVALFTVDQPPQFIVDAGEDQVFSGSPLTLGGQPTASGGGEVYTFMWEPSAGLDNPTAANPIVQEIAATTVFTVTVTDVARGCVKVGVVEVGFDPSSVPNGEVEQGSRIHPNPAGNMVWVEAKEVIDLITLRSLTGEEVMRAAHPASRTAQLELGQVSEGLYLLTLSLASGELITHKLCKTSSDH